MRFAHAFTPGLIVLALIIAPGCDRAETSTAPVTTTSPAGSSTAPPAAEAKARDHALVRVVHAVPAGATLDVFAGDLVVFEGVGFRSVSTYRALGGKRYAFALRPAGMPNAKPLASNTEGLNDGGYYTVFALPGDGRVPLLRVVGDNLDQPASDKARLRIVHAGAGAGEIDIHAPGPNGALFDGVDFQTITNYKDVNPLNGVLEIRAAGMPSALLMLPNAHIEGGRFYTVVLTGNARSIPRLEAFIIEDALATPGTR